MIGGKADLNKANRNVPFKTNDILLVLKIKITNCDPRKSRTLYLLNKKNTIKKKPAKIPTPVGLFVCLFVWFGLVWLFFVIIVVVVVGFFFVVFFFF